MTHFQIRFLKALGSIWPYAAYALLLGISFYVRGSFYPLWQDEILTLYQVNALTFTEFAREFSANINSLPYLYFCIIWLVGQVSELTPMMLRFPSYVFMLVGVCLIHSFLRRRLGQRLAFAAVFSTLLVSERTFVYVFEARPYALYYLAAAFQVVTAGWLVESKVPRVQHYLWLALAAFLLPAIHYFGLFYSGAAFLAVAIIRWKERAVILKCLGAFCAGWIVFMVIHLSLILVIICGEPPLNSHSSPMKASEYLLRFFDPLEFPPQFFLILGVACLLALALHRVEDELRFPALDASGRLMIVMGLCFLCVRFAMEGTYQMGLYDLYVPRYTLPHSIGLALVAGGFLFPFHRLLNQRLPVKGFSFPLDGKTALSAVVAVAFVAQLWGQGLHAASATKSPTNEEILQAKFPGLSQLNFPIVFISLGPFLIYYHYAGQPENLYLLRETDEFHQNYSTLEPGIRPITVDDLQGMESFVLYLGDHRRANDFPSFSPPHWAEQNGYTLVRTFESPGGQLFLLSKSENIR